MDFRQCPHKCEEMIFDYENTCGGADCTGRVVEASNSVLTIMDGKSERIVEKKVELEDEYIPSDISFSPIHPSLTRPLSPDYSSAFLPRTTTTVVVNDSEVDLNDDKCRHVYGGRKLKCFYCGRHIHKQDRSRSRSPPPRHIIAEMISKKIRAEKNRPANLLGGFAGYNFYNKYGWDYSKDKLSDEVLQLEEFMEANKDRGYVHRGDMYKRKRNQ